MDSLDRLSGVDWTFGGGTAMRLFYRHRQSKDIDIFMHDPQLLMSLSPRLNDVVEGLAPRTYTEQSNFLKMHFDEGEIDFILAPRLLAGVPPEVFVILGRQVRVDTPAEIVAKKCFYRAIDFTVRDVFDFAVLLDREPEAVESHADVFFAKWESLQARIEGMGSEPERFHQEIDALSIEPDCLHIKNTALATVAATIAEHRPQSDA